MDDFASAAMMRVVQQGLRRQGIVTAPLAPSPQGRVRLQDKRARLDVLWRTAGPLVIARLGEAVFDLVDDPLLQSFAPARNPADLLERWQRLERFVHSRHRVIVEDVAADRLRWRHVSLDETQPPTPAEDLLVAGLLLALARRVGFGGLRARSGGRRVWTWIDGTWHLPRKPSGLADWTWRWRAGREDRPAVVDVAAPALLDRLQRDPARGWTLGMLAREADISPRSLQRRLQGKGQHFSSLLAQARLNAAAHLLLDSQAPLAEVGYLSGFADQSHFTRQFRRHTGLTPALYRLQFARPG